MNPLRKPSCRRPAALLAALLAVLLVRSPLASAQTTSCDQGVVRLPDRTGTVTICSALATQVPQLSRQLSDAQRMIGQQGAQLRELTRLIKGLNAVGAGLDPTRQARMLASLSSELARAERAGGDRPQRTVEELGDQLDALRDQLSGNLAQERSATATRRALQGPVGDAIAQLELRSAARQLDDIQQQLAHLQSDVGEVKTGVATANQTLIRIEQAVDPALAADRCATLECALTSGTSAASVRRLFDKGARLTGNAMIQAELIKVAALMPRPDRLQVLDILLQHGTDLRMPFNPVLMEPQLLTPAGRQLTDTLWPLARLDDSLLQVNGSMQSGDAGVDRWNRMAGCLSMAVRNVNLAELAALLGDGALFDYLRQHGVTLPERELRCQVTLKDRTRTLTRLPIDPLTGRVAVGVP